MDREVLRGCRDGRSAKMMEIRHSLESNLVPTSFFFVHEGQ